MDPTHASHLISAEVTGVLVSREWLESNPDWSELGPLTDLCAKSGIPVLATISASDQGIRVARILDHGFDEVLSEGMTTHEILGRFRHAREIAQQRMVLSRDLGIDHESGLWTRIVANGCLIASQAFSARNSEPFSVSLILLRTSGDCTPRRRSQAISRMASSLRSSLRTEDQLFRISPDCLLVIWTRTPRHLAEAAMDRVLTSLRSCHAISTDINIAAIATHELDPADDPTEALARFETQITADRTTPCHTERPE
jgi:hypothetical protein